MVYLINVTWWVKVINGLFNRCDLVGPSQPRLFICDEVGPSQTMLFICDLVGPSHKWSI